MGNMITALFTDSKHAGEAVAELKASGFADDISIVTKDDTTGENRDYGVKDDRTEGTLGGAAVGGVAGTTLGLLAGATTAAIPGVGLVAAGPVAAAVTGAVTGATVGGIAGYLTDNGVSEEDAQTYEERLQAGDVLVTVDVDDGRSNQVASILEKHHASQMNYGMPS